MREQGVRVAVAGIVCGVVALAPVLAVGAAEVDSVTRVSRVPARSRTFEGPAVAVDPRNSDLVYVAASDLQASTCHVFRSTDGGRSYAEVDPPDFGRFTDCGLNRGGIPQNMRMKLVVDPEGVLYWAVAVADPREMGARSIALARSSNRGRSWDVTMVARAPAPATPDEAVANFVPDLFVSPFGDPPRDLWVSWRRSFTEASEKPTEGWAARSTDGGRTFAPEVRGIEANPGFDAPRVVVDRDERVFWVQRERPASAAEGEDPKPSPLRVARSEDGGRTWDDLDLGEEDVVMEEPLAAVSPDGRSLYLVWADGRNGDLDVFFSRTDDGGESWTAPTRVNDDRLKNKRSQKWPRLSVAPDGRIDIAWYDYRHDDEAVPADDVEFFLSDVNDVYVASSDDRGESFENVRVTDSSVDRSLGTYNTQYFVEVPPGLGSAEDRAYVTWSDTRLGNVDTSAQDIFGAAVDLDAGGGDGRWLLIAAEVALALAGLALLVAARRRGRRIGTG